MLKVIFMNIRKDLHEPLTDFQEYSNGSTRKVDGSSQM